MVFKFFVAIVNGDDLTSSFPGMAVSLYTKTIDLSMIILYSVILSSCIFIQHILIFHL